MKKTTLEKWGGRVALVLFLVTASVCWELFVGPKTNLIRTSFLFKDVGTGSLFLVRRQSACGAFQIIEQGFLSEPDGPRELIEYRWRYRTTGLGSLDRADPLVNEGVTRGRGVQFGPFEIPWSASSFGRGYLYYSRRYDEPPAPDEVLVATTSLERLDDADCRDVRWVFRGSSND